MTYAKTFLEPFDWHIRSQILERVDFETESFEQDALDNANKHILELIGQVPMSKTKAKRYINKKFRRNKIAPKTSAEFMSDDAIRFFELLNSKDKLVGFDPGSLKHLGKKAVDHNIELGIAKARVNACILEKQIIKYYFWLIYMGSSVSDFHQKDISILKEAIHVLKLLQIGFQVELQDSPANLFDLQPSRLERLTELRFQIEKIKSNALPDTLSDKEACIRYQKQFTPSKMKNDSAAEIGTIINWYMESKRTSS